MTRLTAFAEAARAVRAGDAEVAIAVGTEKMTGFGKERTLGIFDTGGDRERFSNCELNYTSPDPI